MAFSLYASRSGVTTNLSDSNPFAFESLQEASSAPVVRFQQSGPLQHGVSDLGFRIQPRILELNLRFYAATAAALDTHRQTLMDTFAPLSDISIFLYCQRDDGTTLRLTVFTVGEIEIDLVPENYPGHLHRATLKLRAANPLWLDTVVRSSSYTGSAGTADWWLAGGAIGTAQVLMAGTSPAQNADWSFSGTHTGDFTMAFRSDRATSGFAFDVGTVTFSKYYFQALTSSIFILGDFGGQSNNFGSIMLAGEYNYFHVQNRTAPLSTFYRGTVSISAIGSATLTFTASDPQRKWRSNVSGASVWTPAIPKYALYGTSLTTTQLRLLDSYMSGFQDVPLTTVNAGDVAAYPVIRLIGPMANITITNATTGASFSLGTTAIAAGDIYTVDLRDGDKRVYDAAGVSKMANVSSPATLGNFYLAPAPIAAGGTNVIVASGDGTVSTSRVTVEHYNQYMSF